MSNPDRRECPFCHKPFATREERSTGRLVLSNHGGKLVPNTEMMSGLRGVPSSRMKNGCRGSGLEVERRVVKFRARGVGRYPADAWPRDDEMSAKIDAETIVRYGTNGNTEAVWQRFDLPTQSWVTVGQVKARE